MTTPPKQPSAARRPSQRIIFGGENIEAAEIEAIALADAAVAEAAVVGVADARWGEVPLLALVLRPRMPSDLERLRAALENRLARFKHPWRIVVLDALPKTALGKVRKQDLALRLA